VKFTTFSALFLFFLSACALRPPSQVILPSEIPIPYTATQPPPTATLIPPTPTPTVQISDDSIADIQAWLTDLADQDLFTGSILIAQEGKILLADGYNLADRTNNLPNTATTRFKIGSITKQFTAMAVMILAGQGKLSIEDPICAYLEDCPASWAAVTIRHLLTHTAGIHDYLDPNVWNPGGKPIGPDQIEEIIKSRPLDFQPGQSWSYSNTGYILLGRIIEQVSDQSYEEFMQQNIFTPLALHNTGFNNQAPNLAIGYDNGYTDLPAEEFLPTLLPLSDGGMISTVEDLYLWEQALSGETLVTQEQIVEMLSPLVRIPESDGMSYGFGWAVGEMFGHIVQSHSGGVEGFSSFIFRFPDNQITIILLMNRYEVPFDSLFQVLMKKIFGPDR